MELTFWGGQAADEQQGKGCPPRKVGREGLCEQTPRGGEGGHTWCLRVQVEAWGGDMAGAAGRAGSPGAGAGVSTGVWEAGGLGTGSQLCGVCPPPGSAVP